MKMSLENRKCFAESFGVPGTVYQCVHFMNAFSLIDWPHWKQDFDSFLLDETIKRIKKWFENSWRLSDIAINTHNNNKFLRVI